MRNWELGIRNETMRAQRETIRMGMDGNYENYENG